MPLEYVFFESNPDLSNEVLILPITPFESVSEKRVPFALVPTVIRDSDRGEVIVEEPFRVIANPSSSKDPLVEHLYGSQSLNAPRRSRRLRGKGTPGIPAPVGKNGQHKSTVSNQDRLVDTKTVLEETGDEEFVIDRLVSQGQADDGTRLYRLHWYG